ncbi:BQ5605_C003g02362 [Microbotryum silenes-dioicae]|uniref:BQ5605_C003g02362 protein n=1 Tax=Microbotryum silenes-dioicae TaxID=796604 RepID=A0A2X0M5R5_9BASI|nr:BQ5605_C003g02362 [Microbotryum silenes-dioicae]
MSVQTPRPVRGPPCRHPSIEFRASPLRSASRASPTTPAPNHSTNPTTVLGHWRPRLTHEDRRDSSELRKKIKIEAIAALFKLDQFGSRDRYDAVFVTAPTGLGKSVIFEAMYLTHRRRAVTIVAANLNRQGKKAVVCTCVDFPSCLLRVKSPEMHINNADWAKLISNESFRERVKLLVYDEDRGWCAFTTTGIDTAKDRGYEIQRIDPPRGGCSGELTRYGVCLFGSFLVLYIVALDVDDGDREKRRTAKRTQGDQAERSRLADDESANYTMRSDHLRPDRPRSQTSDRCSSTHSL